MVVDEGVAEVGERQPAEPGDDLVGTDAAGDQLVEQGAQRRFVHGAHSPIPIASRLSDRQGHERTP
jgi:hypothetical protein